MVEVDNISLKYGDDTILKGINCTIREGECILFTGESGSGKSSIINSINGLATKYDGAELSGAVKVFDKIVNNMDIVQISMLISSVFQNPKTHFFNVNTTLELLFYLENIGLSREEMDARMSDMLVHFPIRHLLNRSIFKLSGGEKQILCVAASYISGCKIIVLDEPSSNLDEAYIDVLSNMLSMLKKLGITLILAEHRVYYLMGIVDRVFVIKNGELIKQYEKEEFLSLSGSMLEELGIRALTKTNLNVCYKGENSEKEELAIKKLSFEIGQFRKLELKEISFDLGKIYGIIGKNGCGKSSFARCFLGLEKKCKDEIYLFGKKLSKKERLKLSSFVMQDVNHQLFSNTVEKEVILGTSGITQSEADNILNCLGLLELKEKHPMSLSGGQKQRVAIASVLCKKSKFIFFDEPTSGMDYKNMVKISRIVKEMKRNDNIVFIISHDKEFLNMTVDEVVNMEEYSIY